MNASSEPSQLAQESSSNALSLPLISRERFAELSGIPDGVLKGWISKGYIPVYHVGKYCLVNLATRTQIGFLTREEIDALLRAPDLRTYSGRRDHALILLAVQTGLRLSEIIGLCRRDFCLTTGAHVRVVGKGRKERSTPLTKSTANVLRAWLREIESGDDAIVFSNARGGRLSADGVQYLLAKQVAHAAQTCTSLAKKKVTPHVLRHTMAMELLQAGVERSVIALWLGHESIETTQIYLDANLEMKQAALDKVEPQPGRIGRYRPDDALLAFLKSL